MGYFSPWLIFKNKRQRKYLEVWYAACMIADLKKSLSGYLVTFGHLKFVCSEFFFRCKAEWKASVEHCSFFLLQLNFLLVGFIFISYMQSENAFDKITPFEFTSFDML